MSYYSKEFDEKIVISLQNGGVGFMPSDTVYGLSAVALNKEAVEKIYKLKQRDSNKPLIILLANAAQAASLGLNPKDLEPAATYWPAPLTLVCPAGPKTPEFLHRGTNSLAVRIPDNNKLRGLIAKTGPIISTSANLQREKVAANVSEAEGYFGSQLDFYVNAGVLAGQPSTLVQMQDGQLKVLRQGVYKLYKE